MKKTITTYIICLWISSVFGQTTFSIEGGNVNVDKSVSIVLENTTWQNDGSFIADSGTVFFVDGNIITGLSPTTFYSLAVNNTNTDIELLQNVEVDRQIQLINGKVRLNDFNLELADGIIFSGFSEDNYIETNGNGQLIQTVGSTAILYPIGASTLNPALITNNGTISRIGISIQDTTLAKSVNRIWTMDELDGNTIDIELSLIWDDLLAASDFIASESSIIDLEGNNSFTPVFSMAQMSSIFPTFTVQTRDSITQSSTFTVGSDLSISVEEVLSESSISIFPNPASHYLKIQSDPDSYRDNGELVQMFSINGQLVKEFQHQSTMTILPITDLPSGTYLIKTNQQVQKLIIEK